MTTHDEIRGANPCLSTITVAIPIYNSARYIGTAIKSVLRQSHQDFAIIVVDDGSTDNGIEIVKSFADERISIYGQHHYGPAAARNRALALAKYEFVAFLDSDDIWYQDHLKHLVELKGRFPEANLLGNAFRETDETNHHDEVKYSAVDYIEAYGNGDVPFYTSSCMVRRSAALAVRGFPVGDVCGEDLTLWFNLAATGQCAASSYIGTRYIRRPDSLMGPNSELRLAEPKCLSVLQSIKNPAAIKCYRRIARNQMIDCARTWHWWTALQYARKLCSV